MRCPSSYGSRGLLKTSSHMVQLVKARITHTGRRGESKRTASRRRGSRRLTTHRPPGQPPTPTRHGRAFLEARALWPGNFFFLNTKMNHMWILGLRLSERKRKRDEKGQDQAMIQIQCPQISSQKPPTWQHVNGRTRLSPGRGLSLTQPRVSPFSDQCPTGGNPAWPTSASEASSAQQPSCEKEQGEPWAVLSDRQP